VSKDQPKEVIVNRNAVSVVIAAAAISVSAWTLAADKPAAQGMQGMQGMMSGCPMMGGGMGGHMQGGGMMPQLPPGNEKLQLQMWGEMMQKMGEIASKYAAQVK
jgi:hypothetical protein